MEGDTSRGMEAVKVIENSRTTAEPIEVKNEKREEDEGSLDGEFIKVERDDGRFSYEDSPRKQSASRQILEAAEKINDLEIELERVSKALKDAELEYAELKHELLLTKDKFEESGKTHAKLELDHNKLQEKMREVEENFTEQLKTSQEQETKLKELAGVKEAFDSLNFELESSRKKMEELEKRLQSSLDEVRKFEELHSQSNSLVDFEAKRASELESLLEEAKVDAKEMEEKIASLQSELKSLNEKLSESVRVQEALKIASMELSVTQEELQATRENFVDLEKAVSSKDAQINEMTLELKQLQSLEHHLEEEISAMDSLLSSTKDDLQLKVSELERIELKCTEEIALKISAENALKTQEEQVILLEDELYRVAVEKQALDETVADLTSNVAQLKDKHTMLELKLHVSEENFGRVNTFLVGALEKNAELEDKLRILHTLHDQSRAAAASASQRNLELEEIIKDVIAATEEAKLQIQGLESKLKAAEGKNTELEEQLTLVEAEHDHAEKELEESLEKLSESEAQLKELESEREQVNRQMQSYKEKIAELESALCQAGFHNSELEEKLKKILEQSAQHEERANATCQRSLELEDLLRSSRAEYEGADKRVIELESQLGKEKDRIQELEEQISTSENKCKGAEADVKAYSDKVSELKSEVEKLRWSISSLEEALHIANEKERTLTESLNESRYEKTKTEKELNSSINMILELERVLEDFKGKNAALESELSQASLHNTELEVELKKVSEQSGSHEGRANYTHQRSLELEELLQCSYSLLQSSYSKFENADKRVMELESLLEAEKGRVQELKEQIRSSEEKYQEAEAQSKAHPDTISELRSQVEKLKRAITEAEGKTPQSLSDKTLLVDTNAQLQKKINELEELLDSANSEKEAVADRVSSHLATISELTELHRRSIELHSGTEARSLQAQALLEEANQKLADRELQVKELNEILLLLEGQFKTLEMQSNEAYVIADSKKLELENMTQRLQDQEKLVQELQQKLGDLETHAAALAEANMKVNEELAGSESELIDLKAELSATLSEKEDALEQVKKKAHEEMVRRLTDLEEVHESEISSVKKENILLQKALVEGEKKLEHVIGQTVEEVKEYKSRETALKAEIENLKVESAQRLELQTKLKELEEKKVATEAQLKEVVKNVQAAAMGREADLLTKLEEHVQKVKDRDTLAEEVQQLEQELKHALTAITQQREENCVSIKLCSVREGDIKRLTAQLDAKTQQVVLLEKEIVERREELRVISAKGQEATEALRSRVIRSGISSPTRRKSTKNSEAAQSSTSILSTLERSALVAGVSDFMARLTYLLGIVLLSVLVSIIMETIHAV